ncbi:MAG: hypothetical protein ACYSR4_08555, partial [Planctomycetota bacterium]
QHVNRGAMTSESSQSIERPKGTAARGREGREAIILASSSCVKGLKVHSKNQFSSCEVATMGDNDHSERFCFDGYENCSYFVA